MSKKTAKQGQSPEQNNLKTGGASIPRGDQLKPTSQVDPNEIFAVRFLKGQHEELKRLFSQMEGATTEGERLDLLERVASFFHQHSRLEEKHLYPNVSTQNTQRFIEQGRQDHRKAEERLEKMLQLTSFGDDFIDQFKSVVDEIERHIEEEEGQLFPSIAKEIPMSTLITIGLELEKEVQPMARPSTGAADAAFDLGEE